MIRERCSFCSTVLSCWILERGLLGEDLLDSMVPSALSVSYITPSFLGNTDTPFDLTLGYLTRLKFTSLFLSTSLRSLYVLEEGFRDAFADSCFSSCS